MTSFGMRLLRTASLRADAYEEVEADRSSIWQAIAVVLGACTAIGAARYVLGAGAEVASEQLAFQVVLSIIEPLVIWTGGSAFVYMVGASFFRGPETETDFAEVLRTTGFAFTPGLLLIFTIVPSLGFWIGWLVRGWIFVAFVVAIRQALDFTTGRAVGTFGLAAILLWLMLWGLSVAPLPF